MMTKIIKVCGIAFILMWIFQATYLFQHFPFSKETKEYSQQVTNEASQLPASIHAGTVIENKTPDTTQKEINAALKLNWVKGLALTICGIILGCLLFMQKPMGYLFTFVFSFGLLLYKSFTYFSGSELSMQSYVLFFKYFPLQTLREIIMVLVLLVTAVVLASAYVGKIFKRNDA